MNEEHSPNHSKFSLDFATHRGVAKLTAEEQRAMACIVSASNNKKVKYRGCCFDWFLRNECPKENVGEPRQLTSSKVHGLGLLHS